MILHKLLLTENDCFKAGRTIAPKGVMVHSTGKNNPYVSRYVQPDDGVLGQNKYGNHWNQGGILTCVHAFIGKATDGSVVVYQTLPWARRAWHSGRGPYGSANDTHISFEICEDGLDDPVYFAQVYQAAVELTAMLCKDFGFDPLEDGVVICHQEGRRRGIASNHGDVEHWFPLFGKTMDDFRADVAREMEGEDDMSYEKFSEYMKRYEAERAAQPASDWAKAGLAKAKAKGITDGTRPKSYATREEVAQMMLNSSK